MHRILLDTLTHFCYCICKVINSYFTFFFQVAVVCSLKLFHAIFIIIQNYYRRVVWILLK